MRLLFLCLVTFGPELRKADQAHRHHRFDQRSGCRTVLLSRLPLARNPGYHSARCRVGANSPSLGLLVHQHSYGVPLDRTSDQGKKQDREALRGTLVGNKMADKFKCPSCGSGRTKPLSVATSTGTRRRNTVGVSRRSVWGSSSTYRSDFVSSLPSRPSNGGAYLCIFLGLCGMAFAALVFAQVKGAEGFGATIGVLGFLFLLGGIRTRKESAQLANDQASWDKRWVCARCGHQWQA